MPATSASSIAKLHDRRRALLDQIADLEQIRRGSITEQFVETILKDGSKSRRGPYVIYSYKARGGRTVSRRLHDPAEIARYRSQIEAFREFQQCTAQLLALGEVLSDYALEDAEAQKKTSNAATKRKPRSSGS